MTLSWRRHRLDLRHKWTLSRGNFAFKEYAYLEITHDGFTGYGEAAHSEHYGESLESVEATFAKAAKRFGDEPPDESTIHGSGAAAAAIEMATLDWHAKHAGVPLGAFLGIPQEPVTTSFSIGIDTDRKALENKIREAEAFPLLKIKLGTDDDRRIIDIIRSLTDKPLRVDANEGWQDRDHAAHMCEWLAGHHVEFVEQPLPANRLDDVAWLRKRSPLPLLADEDVLTSHEIPQLAGAYDGINVKLMKAGGIREALRMIDAARSLEMRVMLGCMIESSLAITAASHIAPRVDHVDLDGNLLITNDPFTGSSCVRGIITPPTIPGIGAIPTKTPRTP